MLGAEAAHYFAPAMEITAPGHQDLDITDPRAVSSFVAGQRFDYVLNCAAMSQVDRAQEDPGPAFAVNAGAVANLARAVADSGGVLVQVSTDYVFDGRAASPYREDDLTGPLCVYGASKLKGEQAAAGIMPPQRLLVVRTQWMFGRRRSNTIDFFRDRLAQGRPVSAIADQWGSPTWALHLVAAIDDLLKAKASGVFHVSSAGQCSWYEMCLHLACLMGADPGLVTATPMDDLRRPAPRPRYCVLSKERFRNACGRDMPSWQEALSGYLRA